MTASLTADQVIGLPLGDVLTAANAEIVDTSIDDAKFFGLAMKRESDGQLLLAMPAGRDEVERAGIARFLIASWLRLDLGEFPAVLRASHLDRAGNVLAEVGGGWQVPA